MLGFDHNIIKHTLREQICCQMNICDILSLKITSVHYKWMNK